MEPTPKQQAVSLITRSQKILVVPGKPDGDSIGSALAMMQTLRKLNKEVAVATLDPITESFNFLPGIQEITSELDGQRDFIITLTNAAAEPEKLSYNYTEGHLNIVITPKAGTYSSDNVTFTQSGFKYDLIVTVDAPDFHMLGAIYEQHPDLFRETPLLNLDHHASNAYFGAVNIVDLTATSTGEMLVAIIEALNVEIDADMATGLLTGIIADTGSFQHANTTPKSLTVAAQLVAAGAKQQEIIKYLFKTKSLNALKLWGKILSGIQFDPAHKLVWATVSQAQLAETGATSHDVDGLIDELLTSVPGAEVVLLLSEKDDGHVKGSLRTAKGVDAAAIAGLFGGGGHPGAAGFKLPDSTLSEVEQQVVSKIREYQVARLGTVQMPPKVGAES